MTGVGVAPALRRLKLQCPKPGPCLGTGFEVPETLCRFRTPRHKQPLTGRCPPCQPPGRDSAGGQRQRQQQWRAASQVTLGGRPPSQIDHTPPPRHPKEEVHGRGKRCRWQPPLPPPPPPRHDSQGLRRVKTRFLNNRSSDKQNRVPKPDG